MVFVLYHSHTYYVRGEKNRERKQTDGDGNTLALYSTWRNQLSQKQRAVGSGILDKIPSITKVFGPSDLTVYV